MPPPSSSPPPPPGSLPLPPGHGPPGPSNTYTIGGFEISKQLFWLGLAAGTLGTGLFLDNVPGAAKDGDLSAYDFFPPGLYVFSFSFFIAGVSQ
jgi:hypothetical protein